MREWSKCELVSDRTCESKRVARNQRLIHSLVASPSRTLLFRWMRFIVVGVELGELLCGSLDVASGATLLRFAVNSTEVSMWPQKRFDSRKAVTCRLDHWSVSVWRMFAKIAVEGDANKGVSTRDQTRTSSPPMLRHSPISLCFTR